MTKNTLINFLRIQKEILEETEVKKFSAWGMNGREYISNDNLNPKAIMCECWIQKSNDLYNT